MESWFSIFYCFLKRTLFFSFVLLSFSSFADVASQRENHLLSAFVYKVAKFITWPQINSTDIDHFDLCVIDNPSFTDALKEAVSSRFIGDLDIHVSNINNEIDLNHCHLLYFQDVDEKTVIKFLNATKGRSILTVANSSNFIKLGGMIAFERSQNKMTLAINNEKAKKEGLSISAHLLRLNRLKQ